MRIYAITNHDREKKPQGYRSTWPYQAFFHGDTTAEGGNRYGEKPYKPFPLIRNIRLMPKVFFASIWMIVDADVASAMSDFDNIDLVECEWESVYDYPVDEAHISEILGRFSVFTEEFCDWQKSQYKQPSLAIRKQKYFQVLSPRLESVINEFQPVDRIDLPGATYKKNAPIITCGALHSRYPVVRSTPYYLCATPVFDLLRDHVSDPASFKVHELGIEG